MPDAKCTSTEAIAATSYLNNTFGGYPMGPEERRPYMRLFVTFTPDEVQGAIDHLSRNWQGSRRPMPNDIAQTIVTLRPPPSTGGPYLEEFLGDAEMPEPDERARLLAELKDPTSALRGGR